MMRIAVTGSMGQVATSLVDSGGARVRDRPAWPARFLARGSRGRSRRPQGRTAGRGDQRRRLYRRRPGRGGGAPCACRQRRRGRPCGGSRRPDRRAPVELSTDYVFDGALDRPYREEIRRPEAPTGAPTLGERLVAERCADSVILRTAWVFSPYGPNFVRNDACPQRDARRGLGRRRPARQSDLGPRPRHSACSPSPRRARDDSSPALRGVFNMTGSGEATWADFAEASSREARRADAARG